MTADEFLKLGEDVSFGYPLKAWGARFTVRHSATDDSIALGFEFDVPDRGDGTINTFRSVNWLDRRSLGVMSRSMLLTRMHVIARSALLHELDESFLVNGVRIYDPHEAESYAAAERERQAA